jgi:intracellular multiplication protein IcmL
MAAEDFQVVELRDDFYRDSFGNLLLIIIGLCIGIVLLIALSIYIYLDKPKPVAFQVSSEWRVQAPVPLDQPYLTTPEVLQWVADVIPRALVFDFLNYDKQLKAAQQFFTDNGWKAFLNQLNIYANYNNVQNYKLYVNATLTAAPYLLNEGFVGGKYGWWIQVPLSISYAGAIPQPTKTIVLKVLVVRVSTLNNLMGVAIENVTPAPPTVTT